MSQHLKRPIAGDMKLAPFPCDPVNYPMDPGDLVYLHPSKHVLCPATAIPPDGNEGLNQRAFCQDFVGVLCQKVGLHPGEISFKPNQNREYEAEVATGGRWEFWCPAGTTWLPGQPVGIYATAAGIPDTQTVDAIASPGDGGTAQNQMIGIAQPQLGALEAQRAGTTNPPTYTGAGLDRIVVDIKPNTMLGGVRVAETGGGTSGQ